jgi:hypothetical protein
VLLLTTSNIVMWLPILILSTLALASFNIPNVISR